MRQRIIALIILFIVFITGCLRLNSSVPLMSYGEFKNITKNNIKQIEVIRFTEGGDEHKNINKESFSTVYDNLSKKKIGKKTNMSCEDNTTIYIFTLESGEKISIEIECDWVVINNVRYTLE